MISVARLYLFKTNLCQMILIFLAAPDETNSIRILKNGISQNHSPSDTSLITCVALTKDCQTIAYGCSNGSVRLYFPASKSVKMLGTHSTKVKMNFTIQGIQNHYEHFLKQVFFEIVF